MAVEAVRIFTEGTEVEVCKDQEDFRGSFYSAVIVKAPFSSKTGRRRVTVEYNNLIEGELSQTRLRETINVSQIRPVPPTGAKNVFKQNNFVDAYFNGGWWEGVVLNVLENGRFRVYFRCLMQEKELEEEDLRIHREWVYGDWVPAVDETPRAIGITKGNPQQTLQSSANDQQTKKDHSGP